MSIPIYRRGWRQAAARSACGDKLVDFAGGSVVFYVVFETCAVVKRSEPISRVAFCGNQPRRSARIACNSACQICGTVGEREIGLKALRHLMEDAHLPKP